MSIHYGMHHGVDIEHVLVYKEGVVITFKGGEKITIRAQEEFSYTHPNGNRRELEVMEETT